VSQTQGLIQEPQFLRSQVIAQQSSVLEFLKLSIAQIRHPFNYISISRQYPYSYFRF